MCEDSKEGSVSSRLFLNSIKGLNKIFGFVKGGGKDIREMISTKIESIYKIVHTTTNTKAKVQLYLFLFQYYSHLYGSISDRFYRSLYDFINNSEILHCSLAEVFFDLLLISLQQDSNTNRVLAFIKRILQLCFTAQPNFIATTLIMLSKLFQEKEALKVMIQQKEDFMRENTEATIGYDPTKREPIFAGA
jgi:ribosome biogenesis protein MAK21